MTKRKKIKDTPGTEWKLHHNISCGDLKCKLPHKLNPPLDHWSWRKNKKPSMEELEEAMDGYVHMSGIAFIQSPEERIAELEKLTRTLVIRQCLFATALLLAAVILFVKEIY